MKNRSGEKIKLTSIDELLGVVNEESAMEIEINRIHAFIWNGRIVFIFCPHETSPSNSNLSISFYLILMIATLSGTP